MPFQVPAWVILIEFLRGAAASQICYRIPRDYSASRGLRGKIIRSGCEETWWTKTGVHFLVCFEWYFELGSIIGSRVLPAIEQKKKIGNRLLYFIFYLSNFVFWGFALCKTMHTITPLTNIFYLPFLPVRMHWSIPYGMLSFPFLGWVRMTFACIIPAMSWSEFELAPNIVITSLFYLNTSIPAWADGLLIAQSTFYMVVR